jgi:cytochrome c biogenesis protein CcmG/thiol:disulfide interchange protein DsbE
MGSGMMNRRMAFSGLSAMLVGALGARIAAAAGPVAAEPAGTGPIDLSVHRGKVVYVDFWASWCVPCKQSFPWMNTMHRQYGKDGLVIIAVNMDQVREEADAFLRKYPAEFKVHYDPAGQLAPQFKVRGMPTSALLGRDGKVLLIHEGFKSKDTAKLEQAIRDALR